MEESLNDALLCAGEQLAEAMRIGLSRHGLGGELCVAIEGMRVVIASRSAAVRDAEVGTPSTPPKAIMESIARDEAEALLITISKKLRDALS